jgi:ribosomal protein S18 acetylase RimI-like enzyme
MLKSRSPVASGYYVRPLDRDSAERLVARLLQFTADQDWENWTAHNVLANRPRKWELSLLASDPDEPVGYAIVSAPAPDNHHLHHIAVAPDTRGRGIGEQLMGALMSRAQSESCFLTLKVHAVNTRAIDFYCRLGFQILSSVDEQLLMSISPAR